MPFHTADKHLPASGRFEASGCGDLTAGTLRKGKKRFHQQVTTREGEKFFSLKLKLRRVTFCSLPSKLSTPSAFANVEKGDVRQLVQKGKIGLLLAEPECQLRLFENERVDMPFQQQVSASCLR